MAREIKQGNDIFMTLMRSSGGAVAISYWNMWMLIILSQYFNNDWAAMRAHFKQHRGRDNREALLSHAHQLQKWVAREGVSFELITKEIDPDLCDQHGRY